MISPLVRAIWIDRSNQSNLRLQLRSSTIHARPDNPLFGPIQRTQHMACPILQRPHILARIALQLGPQWQWRRDGHGENGIRLCLG